MGITLVEGIIFLDGVFGRYEAMANKSLVHGLRYKREMMQPRLQIGVSNVQIGVSWFAFV
jgi:hypothetical protein